MFKNQMIFWIPDEKSITLHLCDHAFHNKRFSKTNSNDPKQRVPFTKSNALHVLLNQYYL